MYAAHNLKGELVYATNAIAGKSEVYLCPVCRQSVYLKQSSRGKAYFSHGQMACGQTNSLLSKGESHRHQLAKTHLKAHCQRYGLEAVIEWPLAVSGQVADIYLPQKQVVLEYQQSVISAQVLQQRHQAYLKQGIKCYWVLDERCLKTKYITRWHLNHLQFQVNLGNYWLAYHASSSTPLRLFTGLPMVFHRKLNRLAYQAITIEQLLSHGQDLQYRWPLVSYQSIERLTQLEQSRLYARLLAQPTCQPALKRLYQYHFKLQDLPPALLADARQLAYIATPLWLCVAWLITAFQHLTYQMFSVTDFYELCQGLVERGCLIRRPNCYMDETVIQAQWDGLLTCLMQYQLVKKITPHTYCYQYFY